MHARRTLTGLHLLLSWSGAVLAVCALAVVAIAAERGSSHGFIDGCRQVLLPDPITRGALVAACAAFGLGTVALALRSAIRQYSEQRGLLTSMGSLQPLSGHTDVAMFVDERPLAFCAGLRRPRIYISSGAVARLTRDELHAVAAHERHHARRRDPLRVVVMRVLAESLFFLPVLRPLSDRHTAMLELTADEASVRACGGDPRPLARALLAFDDAVSAPAVGIAPERVDQLLGRPTPWPLPVALVAWALVVLAGLAAIALRGLELTAHRQLDVGAFGVQLCLVMMAVAPLMAAMLVLVARRRLAAG
jgi:hypothetical protein